MNMKHSFEKYVEGSLLGSIDKLNNNFHINDKTRELKQHYGGTREKSKTYDTSNFRRGTQSHI